ncbi:hypothetical protein SAMN05421759_1353 [Roseivivax lentus]|uniref:Uncharacterized protein n=1 Tax=Roseivivax lentus TaxID=633194 RepID=A0A1N7Q7G6_9RHOB|nr:hypothetical protein SAMN05421759_1353 [Roseivivax lentus]
MRHKPEARQRRGTKVVGDIRSNNATEVFDISADLRNAIQLINRLVGYLLIIPNW